MAIDGVSSHRSVALDAVTSVITVVVLLFATSIVIFVSYSTSSSPVTPQSSKIQDPYMRAVRHFARLFQRPSILSEDGSVDSLFGSNKTNRRSPVIETIINLDGVKRPRRVLLTDHSLAVDLSSENNMSHTISTLSSAANNHIVATANHLEYSFGCSDAEALLEQHLSLQQQQARNLSKQLQVSYLPPIAEILNIESGSPVLTPRSLLDDNVISPRQDSSTGINFAEEIRKRSPPRRKIPRSIILFSGPEDRNLWLFPDNDDEVDDDAKYDEYDEKSDDEFVTNSVKSQPKRSHSDKGLSDDDYDSQSREKRLHSWIELLRQPIRAWSSSNDVASLNIDSNPKNSPGNNETRSRPQSHFEDMDTIDQFGNQPENLPPFPGSLNPRQLQSISFL